MTDFTTHTARWCEENVRFTQKFSGSRGNIYVVTCNEMNAGPYSVNWHCTCKGWQYKGKCKHQTIAVMIKCSYGSSAAAGSPIEMEATCPVCGGPTIPIEVAS